jgi:hypothetical protein
MAAPGNAARIRLSLLLPWVYGFIALSLLAFFLLFASGYREPLVAAAFFVWVSTFNLLIISVFWSFMADLFSRRQATRLFGLALWFPVAYRLGQGYRRESLHDSSPGSPV